MGYGQSGMPPTGVSLALSDALVQPWSSTEANPPCRGVTQDMAISAPQHWGATTSPTLPHMGDAAPHSQPMELLQQKTQALFAKCNPRV